MNKPSAFQIVSWVVGISVWLMTLVTPIVLVAVSMQQTEANTKAIAQNTADIESLKGNLSELKSTLLRIDSNVQLLIAGKIKTNE